LNNNNINPNQISNNIKNYNQNNLNNFNIFPSNVITNDPTQNYINYSSDNNNYENIDINHNYDNNINVNNNLNQIQNQQQAVDQENIIFDHVFINMDGQKYIPNTNNQIYFDQNLGEFVLPEEIIKEDKITKILRIKAILDSMNFENEEDIKKFQIADPPIIKGIEKIIPQMNKRENFSSEKIDTKIIKHDFENTYFLQKNDMNKKIREPPYFLV